MSTDAPFEIVTRGPQSHGSDFPGAALPAAAGVRRRGTPSGRRALLFLGACVVWVFLMVLGGLYSVVNDAADRANKIERRFGELERENRQLKERLAELSQHQALPEGAEPIRESDLRAAIDSEANDRRAADADLASNVSRWAEDGWELQQRVAALDSRLTTIRARMNSREDTVASSFQPSAGGGDGRRGEDLGLAMGRRPKAATPDGAATAARADYEAHRGLPHQSRRLQPRPPRKFDDVDDTDERTKLRRELVKEEFLFSWRAYKKYAWGRDELKPVSRMYHDWEPKSHGIGVTIFDAMTTLALMNLTKDLHSAIEYVVTKLNFDQRISISAFEATIRIVGSCLSAFELTGESDRRLVHLAEDVMGRLLWAYNTSAAIPHQQTNLGTHRHWSPDWTSGAAVLSEFGSVQLELRTLSFHTGNPLYDQHATHLMDVVEARCKPDDMLCPTFADVSTGLFRDDHITLGALGDSFYEYLLKQYLLTGKTEPRYKDDALQALDAVVRRLLRYSTPSRQAYLAEYFEGRTQHRMDELACYAGGMFALAAMEVLDSGRTLEFGTIAEELSQTCYEMWAFQKAGLAPETVEFPGDGGDFLNGAGQFLLRPETLESLFYVWRLTHKEKYREWAWDIFTALHENCRVPTGGYTGIRNVEVQPLEPDDVQPSYFLAETMKYLYLIFSDDTLLPLQDWVLNTEAHPFRIRVRDPMAIWEAWEDRQPNHALPWEPPTLPRVEVQTLSKRQKAFRLANPGYRVALPKDPMAVDGPDASEDQVDAQLDALQVAKDAAARRDENLRLGRRSDGRSPLTSSAPPLGRQLHPTTAAAPPDVASGDGSNTAGGSDAASNLMQAPPADNSDG